MQLKEMTEKLPPEVSESEAFKSLQARTEEFLKSSNESSLLTSLERIQDHGDSAQVSYPSQDGGNIPDGNRPSASKSRDDEHHPSSEDGLKSHDAAVRRISGGKEVIEQFEPGVYVTLVQLGDGSRVFRRVKFRYSSVLLFSRNSLISLFQTQRDPVNKDFIYPFTRKSAILFVTIVTCHKMGFFSLYLHPSMLLTVNEGSGSNRQKNGGTSTKIGCLEDTINNKR